MHCRWVRTCQRAGCNDKKLTEALEWRLRYTPAERDYLQRKQAPEIIGMVEPESLHLWQAFHYLRGARPTGFGVGPVPFSEMATYCDWAGVACPIDRAFLVRVVTVLDNLEREHHGGTAA